MTDKKLTTEEAKNLKENQIMESIASMTAFYRENPHRFCEDYLGIVLKTFQKILLCIMNTYNYFMFLACRGLGKTYLTAIFCCIRCILYPGTSICIASGKRNQAVGVIEKIESMLMPNSSNLRSEIKVCTTNKQDPHVEFYNGSRIKIATANDNARGARANILVCDEFRLIPLEIITTVLRKFLTAPRHPGYLDNPKYQNLTERNKEIYMSSCWYQSHWSYEKAKTYFENFLKGRKYFVCALPYQLAIKENLLSREAVEDEMSESDFNEVSWQIEMECLFYSDLNGGLYSYEDIEKVRKIKYPSYPDIDCCKIPKLLIQPKQEGEIRILSADIALMQSTKNKNDATSIFLNQMLPVSNRYINNITYTVNQEGLRTDNQALNIRKLVDKFDVDYLVIDGKSIGLPIIDLLMTDLYDQNTGITYPAISCCNNKEIASRCTVSDAPEKIWVVFGSSEFNSQCALTLREVIRQNQIRLLQSEYDFEDLMQEIPNYSKLSIEDKVDLKLPYLNTALLVNELIELKCETTNNVVKVKEKSGMRKDRYSSLSYNIFVAKLIEREKRIITSRESNKDLLFKFRAPKIK